MNLTTVKTAADLPFPGIELVRTDKAISEVIIGGKLRIKAGSYTGLSVLVETPYETVTRYRLTAKLDGFDPKVSHFEYEHEAQTAAAGFEDKGATTAIEKVEVQLDDAGKVVGDNDSAPAAKQTDAFEVPF